MDKVVKSEQVLTINGNVGSDIVGFGEVHEGFGIGK